MGAAFSSSAEEGIGAESNDPLKAGLGEIPEGCVALVLINLDPPEICELARINRAFRQASLADFVWESKLPENYPSLVKKLFDGRNPEIGLSKRDIYTRLCRPIPFDGGTKEVCMEKRSGGICVSISWKGMKITGQLGNYKNHPFHTIAYLQQIWWLQVVGEMDFQFRSGTHSLYFRLQLGKPTRRHGRRVCDLDQIHGWDIKPVQFQFSTTNGHHATTQCYLNDPGKWVHYHVGDFPVDNPETMMKIKFSMTQIDCTHTKGGLCLDSVLILPKELVLL
ncbi:hypothetical protein RHSIM_Rhsim03G0177500 [Rhododendron simsii]|uniref:F-box domain-containing protein n=1 Tax=Rhododendron simsii TaxID=118357 RepID=A0A834LRL1_RHOSS|nr:hypothetical protein RHSIM_Rhsim03G0177500 [Rhododendron simsii]